MKHLTIILLFCTKIAFAQEILGSGFTEYKFVKDMVGKTYSIEQKESIWTLYPEYVLQNSHIMWEGSYEDTTQMPNDITRFNYEGNNVTTAFYIRNSDKAIECIIIAVSGYVLVHFKHKYYLDVLIKDAKNNGFKQLSN